MRPLDYLLSTGRVLSANRFRTVLTLLGIVIGAAAIVFLAGVLRSGDEALVDLTQVVNDVDTIVVRSDQPPLDQAKRTTRPLSEADMDSLRRSLVIGAETVLGESRRNAQASMHTRVKDLALAGGFPGTQLLYKLNVRAGRFLRDEDLTDHARVCVVGDEVWRDLSDNQPFDPAAQPILHVDGVTLLVVGVLEHKPSIIDNPQAMSVWDRKVLIPESTFAIVFGGDHSLDRLLVRMPHRVGGEAQAGIREGLIGALLKRLHLGVENFAVGAKSGPRQQVALIKNIIRLLMICTGVLAMFSGGLNISNIMLIAVGERTREIGVRRALGATRRSIELQFLSESLALSLVGGILGVLLGIALVEVAGVAMVQAFSSWSVHIEGWAVALALVMALFTGTFFGVAPARLAARLDPAEALRSE